MASPLRVAFTLRWCPACRCLVDGNHLWQTGGRWGQDGIVGQTELHDDPDKMCAEPVLHIRVLRQASRPDMPFYGRRRSAEGRYVLTGDSPAQFTLAEETAGG